MRCPTDDSVLTEVVTSTATTGVCPICGGVWIPRLLLVAVAESMRERGWTVYIHWTASSLDMGKCPACTTRLSAYVTPSDSVARCHGCGALWIPGTLLQRESTRVPRYEGPPPKRESIRTEAAVPEPRSTALLGKTADAAGISSAVLDEVVVSSWAAWRDS